MSRKVWVIDDQDWNGTLRELGMEEPLLGERQPEDQADDESPPRNPGLAFSLSLLVWGSGHMYLGQYRSGALCLSAMICFYSLVAGMVCFRDVLSRVIAEGTILPSLIVLGGTVSFLFFLAIWLAQAVAAYYRAEKLSPEPFAGADNQLWPLSVSLVFPGWGQFLNGQPKKGLCFLLFGAGGLLSTLFLWAFPYLWPALADGSLRIIVETGLVSAFLLVPVAILTWVVAAYDAYRSSEELWRKKLSQKNACYRVGSRWSPRNLVPGGTFVLGLLLAISLAMQLCPRGYYVDSLKKAREVMLDRNMQVMPILAEKVIELIDRGGRRP
jgi:TM2 domain-containing membrane protein YozV